MMLRKLCHLIQHAVCSAKAICTKHTIHMGSLFPPQGTTSSDTFVMCGHDTTANANIVMQTVKGHALKMLRQAVQYFQDSN